MKAFMIFLALAIGLGGGWVIWPEIHKAFEQKRPVEEQRTVVATVNASDVVKGKAPLSLPPMNTNPGVPPTPDTPPANPDPGTPSTPEAEMEVQDEYTLKYPMPKFGTIEDVTSGWTKIPSRALPRKVIAQAMIEFQLGGAGKTSVPSGTEVLATGMADGMVIVSRNEADTLRAQVPLASTNLKEVLSGLYSAWVEKRKKQVLELRTKAKYAKDNPAPPPPPFDERTKIAGPVPVQDAEGRYLEMVASLQAKQITEIKLEKIKSWGELGFETYEGKGCWTCTVEVEVTTIFGPYDTEAIAFMHKGKVVAWLYTGTREPVQ